MQGGVDAVHRSPMSGDLVLHPLVAEAAQGRLPRWAVAGTKRREHMERVAELLRDWSKARCESPIEVERWAALGFLHDALRDAKPNDLRPYVEVSMTYLPGSMLHGPATARMLREGGVTDETLLTAVKYHTIGTADFGVIGKALYAADFLEPGREFCQKWRCELRAIMPEQLDTVVCKIVGARVQHLIDKERPVRAETLGFWNTLVKGRSWVSASEP